MRAIRAVGGAAALARKCGVERQAVYQWLAKGLPDDRISDVARAAKMKDSEFAAPRRAARAARTGT